MFSAAAICRTYRHRFSRIRASTRQMLPSYIGKRGLTERGSGLGCRATSRNVFPAHNMFSMYDNNSIRRCQCVALCMETAYNSSHLRTRPTIQSRCFSGLNVTCTYADQHVPVAVRRSTGAASTLASAAHRFHSWMLTASFACLYFYFRNTLRKK
jgi:hypothetical protein